MRTDRGCGILALDGDVQLGVYSRSPRVSQGSDDRLRAELDPKTTLPYPLDHGMDAQCVV